MSYVDPFSDETGALSGSGSSNNAVGSEYARTLTPLPTGAGRTFGQEGGLGGHRFFNSSGLAFPDLPEGEGGPQAGGGALTAPPSQSDQNPFQDTLLDGDPDATPDDEENGFTGNLSLSEISTGLTFLSLAIPALNILSVPFTIARAIMGIQSLFSNEQDHEANSEGPDVGTTSTAEDVGADVDAAASAAAAAAAQGTANSDPADIGADAPDAPDAAEPGAPGVGGNGSGSGDDDTGGSGGGGPGAGDPSDAW